MQTRRETRLTGKTRRIKRKFESEFVMQMFYKDTRRILSLSDEKKKRFWSLNIVSVSMVIRHKYKNKQFEIIVINNKNCLKKII